MNLTNGETAAIIEAAESMVKAACELQSAMDKVSLLGNLSKNVIGLDMDKSFRDFAIGSARKQHEEAVGTFFQALGLSKDSPFWVWIKEQKKAAAEKEKDRI